MHQPVTARQCREQRGHREMNLQTLAHLHTAKPELIQREFSCSWSGRSKAPEHAPLQKFDFDMKLATQGCGKQEWHIFVPWPALVLVLATAVNHDESG
jgi:hypothetical protein